MTAGRFRGGLIAALALSCGLAHAELDRLPRLTAIVIGGGEKVAIFTSPGGGTLAVREGERVGTFTVVKIRPGEARLVSPAGTVAVQPSPDLGARSLWAGQTPATPLIDPAYREAVTETDQ